MKNRFKDKFTWLSILSLVVIILTQLNVFELIGINSDSFKIVIESILSILVLLGILNNPTTKEF